MSELNLTDETPEGAVYLAMGAASVCWEHPEGAGVFDSTRALAIGQELLDYLKKVWHVDAPVHWLREDDHTLACGASAEVGTRASFNTWLVSCPKCTEVMAQPSPYVDEQGQAD